MFSVADAMRLLSMVVEEPHQQTMDWSREELPMLVVYSMETEELDCVAVTVGFAVTVTPPGAVCVTAALLVEDVGQYQRQKDQALVTVGDSNKSKK